MSIVVKLIILLQFHIGVGTRGIFIETESIFQKQHIGNGKQTPLPNKRISQITPPLSKINGHDQNDQLTQKNSLLPRSKRNYIIT